MGRSDVKYLRVVSLGNTVATFCSRSYILAAVNVSWAVNKIDSNSLTLVLQVSVYYFYRVAQVKWAQNFENDTIMWKKRQKKRGYTEE